MAFNRVVVLVDMDCFYVQVEQREDPDKKGKPCAVVQYKKYRGGGIIAIGYEARAQGVTRRMMGDDAKEQCPNIHIFRVPESNGKANLDKYRKAGAEVIAVLSQFGGRVERASIDEAYIDMTDAVSKIISKEKEYLTSSRLLNTHVVGWPPEYKEGEDKTVAREEGVNNWVQELIAGKCSIEDKRLAIAAVITEEIRAAVYHQTGFRCSAGVSHNKMLSKLVCGINKPNQQTILPKASIPKLFEKMKIGKVRNLGGKLGRSLLEDFDIEFMGQIDGIPYDKLERACGSKSANWLKEVCRGIDNEPVKERHLAQSMGCGKTFRGREILNTKSKVHTWMVALVDEMSERLEKDRSVNARVAKSLTVQLRLETGKSLSRSGPLLKYGKKDLFRQCLQLIRPIDTASPKDERWSPAITELSVNAKKFDSLGGSISSFNSFVKRSVSGKGADSVQNFLDNRLLAAPNGGPRPVEDLKRDFSQDSLDDSGVSMTPDGDSSVDPVSPAGLSKDSEKVQETRCSEDADSLKTGLKLSVRKREHITELKDCAETPKLKFFKNFCGKKRDAKFLEASDGSKDAKFSGSANCFTPGIQSSFGKPKSFNKEVKGAEIHRPDCGHVRSANFLPGEQEECTKSEDLCELQPLKPDDFFCERKGADVYDAKNGGKALMRSRVADAKSLFAPPRDNTKLKKVSHKKRNPIPIEDFFREGKCAEVKKHDNEQSTDAKLVFGKPEVNTKEELRTFMPQDVIPADTRGPTTPLGLFFHPLKPKSRKATVCMTDAMFLNESTPGKSGLPDDKVFHPLYGEINREVFKDLPPETQREITISYKITSSVLPSVRASGLPNKLAVPRNVNKNQRLLSHFMSPLKKVDPSTSNLKVERKSVCSNPAQSSISVEALNEGKDVKFSGSANCLTPNIQSFLSDTHAPILNTAYHHGLIR